jgi:lysozyme
MTSPYLFDDLRRDEGLRLIAYPDPASGGAPWTIGYGHTGREVHPGLVWTQSQADTALGADVAATSRGLDTAMPWWRDLEDLRQDCLANQAFNLGVHGLLAFGAYLGLVRARAFAAAASDEVHTLWARQVGDRARRIAEQMRTGRRL